MDPIRFDFLTRRLSDSRTRRGVLGGALAGLLAAVLGAPEAETRHKHGTKKVQTASQPRSCDVGCSGLKAQAKTACRKACRACGGNFDRVCVAFGPVGPSAFTCCLGGTACNFETGACEQVATCPSGEPAENCALGVTTDCGPDGVCALAVNADGGCACVERECSFTECTTGADCESGLCVDIPGCCGDPNPFCGLPCGTGGGEAGARGGGWR
jgi:hypothetical protein